MCKLLTYNCQFDKDDRKKMIGESLRLLRKARKYTQKEVADFIHCTPQAYNNYENGIREPDAETLVRLSYLFDCPTDLLLQKYALTLEDVQKNVETICLELASMKTRALEDFIPVESKMLIAQFENMTKPLLNNVSSLINKEMCKQNGDSNNK